jgi:CheY-like chemotaxis protein
VHFAYGGVDAVKVITRENIDIIVTDMRMPEVDGPKLLEWISEHHPKIIRVVLSGGSEVGRNLPDSWPEPPFLGKTMLTGVDHRRLVQHC